MKKSVKEFSSLYGSYPSEDFIKMMQCVAKRAISMAKQHRDDCVKTDKGVHHENISPCIEAIEFWREINNKCQTWLKQNNKENA